MTPLNIDILSYTTLKETFNEISLGDFRVNILLNPESEDGYQNTIVGSRHTNQLSKFLKDLNEHLEKREKTDRRIYIIFSNEISNYDITFVGLLAVFKKRNPQVEIEIQLPSTLNYPNHARLRDGFFKIRLLYRSIEDINLFTIRDEYSLQDKINEPADPLLIFPVTPTTFQNYFVSTNSSWDIRELIRYIPKTEILAFITQLKESSGTIADQNYSKVALTVKNLIPN